jgi:hypothetical protein
MSATVTTEQLLDSHEVGSAFDSEAIDDPTVETASGAAPTEGQS